MVLTAAAAAGQIAAAAGITAILMRVLLRWMKHMRIATTATAVATV
jgi:hypothetical protein